VRARGRAAQEQLKSVAAASCGLLTITDVELLDGDKDAGDEHHVLRFRCNGEPHEWLITHGPDEDLDASVHVRCI
jgi:hypothetical protein